MRTYSIQAILALAILLAVSATATAQGRITGTVVDAQGEPIEGAAVSIRAVSGIRGAELTTDDDGEFFQIGLASGAYIVTVTVDDLRQALEANVNMGGTEELEFRLTPTSGLTPEQLEGQRGHGDSCGSCRRCPARGAQRRRPQDVQ